MNKNLKFLFLGVAVLAGATLIYFKTFRDSEVKPAQVNPESLSGSWHVANKEKGLSPEERAEMARLSSNPYVQGHAVDQGIAGLKGVTRFVPSRAQPGANFVVSGHASSAQIVSMDGRVLHEWKIDFNAVPWKDPLYQDEGSHHQKFWTRAHVYPNGDLLGVWEGYGLVKLDRDSNVIWHAQGRYHHDMEVLPNGNIWILGRTRSFQSMNVDDFVHHDDHFVLLSPKGKVLKTVSLYKAFQNSKYSEYLSIRDHQRVDDYFHANTVHVVSRKAARGKIKPGFILSSAPQFHSMVMVVDPDREKVVWATSGVWYLQHHPKFLKNGNLLLFDNEGNRKHRNGASQILEMNPFTQEIAWRYEGTKQNPFYSATSGDASRLDNGNTLIIEANNGRGFEVTPDKEIVWEYRIPYRVGDQNELVATLFQLERKDMKQLTFLEERIVSR